MEQKGDFIGFTLDGIHSSELNILRVNDGSRYISNILPALQDQVVDVPGGDGKYFFGSRYKQRNINISIAYDSLTDEDLAKLRKLLSQRKIMTLIFDEEPYKVYHVRPTGNPNLKYVIFDDIKPYSYRKNEQFDNGVSNKQQLYGTGVLPLRHRIYKGEGTLNFITYEPFARSRFKYLDDYTIFNLPEWGTLDNNLASNVYYNLWEWEESSGIIKRESYFQNRLLDNFVKTTNTDIPVLSDNFGGCAVYNPGDLPTPFKLRVDFDGNNKIEYLKIGCENNSLILKEIIPQEQDTGFIINTKLCTIEGIKASEVKGYVFNGASDPTPSQLEDESNFTLTSINPFLVSPKVYKKETYYDANSKTNKYFFKLLNWQEKQVLQKEQIITRTGTLYNKYLTNGDFFKLPNLRQMYNFNTKMTGHLPKSLSINYDYLYL